ncbi:hypothetical protein [Nocardia sp. NPDC004123]
MAVIGVPAVADQRIADALLTRDQDQVNDLAVRLAQTPQVQAEGDRLKQQWSQVMTARLGSLTPQAQAQLDPDIQELLFAYAQKAANADPQRPKISWSGPPHTVHGTSVPGARYAGDVPDQPLRFIPLDNTSTYILTGSFASDRPSTIRFQLSGDVDDIRTITEFNGRDLAVDPDGRFTLMIDPFASGAPNHIQTTPDTNHMIIREVIDDWGTQSPAELTITRTAGPEAAPEKSFDQLISDAHGMLRNQNWIYTYVMALQYPLPPNALLPPLPQYSTDRSFGNFELADNQALIVTTQTGGGSSINLALGDTWTVSLPYWQRQTAMNSKQATANPDGSYTFVISSRDPGVHNWIDTTGLSQGTMFMRWQGLPVGPLPIIPPLTTQVVDLAQLPAVLPAGITMVTPEQRAAQLDNRHVGYRSSGLGFDS